MSDKKTKPDEKKDFNINDYMSDETPSSTSPPSVLTGTKKRTKGGFKILGGDTEVNFKDGTTLPLSKCIDEMDDDESRSCHCLDDDHSDINASASIKKIGPDCVSIICFSCSEKFMHKKNDPKKADSKKGDESKVSITNKIIALCSEDTHFHDESGNPYTEIKIKGVSHTVRIGSKDHEEYISYRYYEKYKAGVSSYAMNEVMTTLSAKAKYDGEEKSVYIRVANMGDRVFLDTCDEERRVIEVNSEEIKFSTPHHVKGEKKKTMASLPKIAEHGDITLLKKYMNLKDSDFYLICAWILCSLAGVKPFLILIIQGEQGTGKSIMTKILRAFIDPSYVPLRGAPKSGQDLMVSASNGYLVVVDNSSGVGKFIGDCICILSTGGAIDERMLKTNSEQCIIGVQRPQIMNGISDIASRQDVADRAIIIEPLVIKPEDRESEKKILGNFEIDKPVIFKALLLGLQSGFKHEDSIEISEKSRMADAINWAAACMRGLGMEDEFLEAYKGNQMRSKQDGIESSPVGDALIKLMATQREYIGTTTELLNKLAGISVMRQASSRAWPQSAKGLTSIINRLKPNLRSVGIDITRGANNKREYVIVNTKFNQDNVDSIFDNDSDDDESGGNSNDTLPGWINK